MAIDKAVDSAALNSMFTSIANAIRAKNGETAQYTPAQMAEAIAAIESGGGGGGGGTIHGHKFITGSFTLASNMTSSYTVLSAADLFDAIKDDFPGATRITDNFYTRGSSTSTGLYQYLAGICWLDEIDNYSASLNVKEWVCSFLTKHSINSVASILGYTNSYGNFTGKMVGSEGFQIKSTGATIGFSSTYNGYAGRRYKYLIYAVDHGAKQ